jgi:aspartate aminotransferase
MTTLSPTAVPSAAAVAVLSTGDVRIPVYEPAGPVLVRRADQPYQPPAGTEELRKAIAARATRSPGRVVDPGGVIVAPGARLAILAALMVVLTRHRREVLLMAPHWPSYPWLVKAAGGVPVRLPWRDGVAWPDRAMLDTRASDATAVVVVNSPRNPDGAVADAATLSAVLDWAVERDIVVLADEVYRGVPLGPPPPSTLDLCRPIDPHCIVVDGLSKSHALAGLRIGWAIAHPRWSSAMVAVCSHLLGSTCTAAQAIARAALADDRARRVLREALRRNLTTALSELAGIPGVRCPAPAGGIFLFPDIRDWLAEQAPDEARLDLVGWLRDRHGVHVVDGQAFGAPGHLRLSFALPPDQLADGLRRVRRALLGGRSGRPR